MSSTKKTLRGTEAEHAISFYEQFCVVHKFYAGRLIHIPNEQKCSKAYGKKLNTMGRVAGVSDYLLDVSKGEYRNLWLEIKAPGKIKNVSDSQLCWLINSHCMGSAVALCEGVDEAMKAANDYISKKDMRPYFNEINKIYYRRPLKVTNIHVCSMKEK